MYKRFLIVLQYLIPQFLISWFMGALANCKITWVKNYLIRQFCKTYAVDLQEAMHTDIGAYPTFNEFFTRQLKPNARPIAEGIVSPADGVIAECGVITGDRLIQAKNSYFTLGSLFANDLASANSFLNGHFATIYLAPHNYHRVHMPITGTLKKTIYIPGRLFSVNRMTTDLVPNLYARNERLICLFATDAGPMAIILVGALIVGSIKTTWMDKPIRQADILISPAEKMITLEKGAELGLFQLGSTVLVLFPEKRIAWENALTSQKEVKMGEKIGNFLQN